MVIHNSEKQCHPCLCSEGWKIATATLACAHQKSYLVDMGYSNLNLLLSMIFWRILMALVPRLGGGERDLPRLAHRPIQLIKPGMNCATSSKEARGLCIKPFSAIRFR
jgi:hypothetical protein